MLYAIRIAALVCLLAAATVFAATHTRAQDAEGCKTTQDMLGVVVAIAQMYRKQVWWRLMDEGNHERLLVRFAGEPIAAYVFVGGCYARTVNGPILTRPRRYGT